MSLSAGSVGSQVPFPRLVDGRASVAPVVIAEAANSREVFGQALLYAPTAVPVLLVGETGTGKEVVAQYIHWASGRSGLPVDVNCAALPESMAESLLFGHRRGAFTGATEHHAGFVEEAEGGTLLLDELLELPAVAQAKLLRVLETGEVRRLGETRPRPTSFRLIATLQEDGVVHRAGRVRMDLFHRLAGVILRLAPLRHRREDIVPLARHFGRQQQRRLGLGCEAVLEAYDWPGNVRELRNVIVRAAVESPHAELAVGVLERVIEAGASVLRSHAIGVPGAPARAEERRQLQLVCAAHGWSSRRIAKALGVSRMTLFRRLKTAGVSLRARVIEDRDHQDAKVSRSTGTVPVLSDTPPRDGEGDRS